MAGRGKIFTDLPWVSYAIFQSIIAISTGGKSNEFKMIDDFELNKDIDLGPGGEPNEITRPTEGLSISTYLITGRVFEQQTSGVGAGLYIYAYQHDGEELIFKKKTRCLRDGSYSIQLLSNEVSLTNPLELFVYQGNDQLGLVTDGNITLLATQKHYLKDLFVAKRAMIKGVVKRKNLVSAAGCLVELYTDKNNDTSSAELIEGAKVFTNINGGYSITYTGNQRNTLRLRYYNNEEVSLSLKEPGDLIILPEEVIDESEDITGEIPAIGQYIEDATAGKVYEVIDVNGISITKRLVLWSDESTPGIKSLWKYIFSDNKNYKVLDKRIIYNADGKSKVSYRRIPEETFNATNQTIHEKTTDSYKSYWSPQLVTSNLEEEVNYLFTNNTLDDYTRITNREEEFISTTPSEDSTIPVRSLIKGYSVEDTPFVASLIGATDEDVQHLSQARDFNSQMKLDQEAILFGLVKKGVELDIAVFFSMSTEALTSKVQEAVNENIIPDQAIATELDAIKDRLLEVVSQEFTDIYKDVASTAVMDVISDDGKRAAFVQMMARYSYENTDITEDLDGEFWAELNFTATEEEQLRRTIQFSEVCNSNEIFINQFVIGGVLSPFSDLLYMTRAQIEAKITAGVLASGDMPDLPAPQQGETEAGIYADYIYNQIEDKFATESLLFDLTKIEDDTALTDKFNALRVKLIDSTMSSSSHFYGIVYNAGYTFNIERDSVRDFLNITAVDDALPDFYLSIADKFHLDGILDLTGVSNDDKTKVGKEEWINFMTLIQRIYSIISHDKFASLKALIETGYHSAYDVVKAGRTNFLEGMQGQLTEEVWLKVFKAAEYKVNKALAMLNKYSGQANKGMPVVVNEKQFKSGDEQQVQLLTLPEMSMLFGDQDITDTKHGESVLGPSAYLVDVLNVLKQFKVSDTAGQTSLYDKLIKRRPDIAQIPLNCTNAITPMPYIDLVMEILENEIHSLEGLPSNSTIKNDTTKTEEQLKTDPEYTRYPVYDKIRKASVTNWLRQPFDLFSEELKLFGKTLGINRTKLAVPYSHLSNVANPYFDILGLTHDDQVIFPVNPTATDLDFAYKAIFGVAPNPVPTKLPVKDFLESAVMTLDEFKTLIDSYYVNPCVSDGQDFQRFTIHYSGKQELSTAYLDFGTNDRLKAFVKRMFQYRRLMMVTEWSIPVLDALLFAGTNYKAYYTNSSLSNGLVEKSEVEYLGQAKMQQEYLGLSDNQVVVIFGQVAVLDYANTTSFINQTFTGNGLPTEHQDTFKEWLTLGDESGAPVNALAYSPDEEPHVFMVYLQESMGLSDEELFDLSYILETDSDNAPKLTANGVQNMVTAWQLAEGFGLAVDELVKYCQLIQFNTTTQLAYVVEKLIQAQKMIIANGANVLELLFLLYHQATADEIKEFEDKVARITSNIFEKKAELKPEEDDQGNLTPEQINSWALDIRTVIEEQLQFNTDLEAAFVIKAYDQQTFGNDTLEDLVVTAETSTEDIVNAIKRCLKGLSLCEQIGIEEADLTNIASSPVAIFAMPLDDTQAIAFDDFNNLAAICQSGQYLKETANRFAFYNFILGNAKVANYSNLEPYISWYSILPIWQHKDEMDLTNSANLNRNLNWFLCAGEINQFLTHYGIASSLAFNLIKWNWATAADAETCVNTIANLARSKANTGVYKEEMSEGRDKLRIKQRDALVQYLYEKSSAQFTDVFDLYSYFLIDTQMTPAVASSRILQATLAVQSFIQRIQLGLETDIVFTKKDAKKWEWMSLYRVWEANRKIFLYPENWLEPELRDNKTPFFKELEKELTGKEVTKGAVESSYMDYINKVEQVANIEICQMYNEEHDHFSVLHVIGRSRFEPREYFYRKLVNESYWTPWEKMGIEINTDHIAPAIIKDRLVAFWLECSDVAKEPSDNDLSVNPDASTIKPKRAQKQLQLQVCWSELIDNKWTRKRSYDEKILVDDAETDEKLDFRLVYEVGESNLLHILNAPNSYIGDNVGYSFMVECFNHVHLTKQSQFSGGDFIMPQGMGAVGQKVQSTTGKAWLSLPVAATNGIAYLNDVVENIKGQTRLVYPHHYKNFYCQSPFVVETNMQSLVFIPAVKAERSSVLLKKVIRYTYTKPEFRVVRKYYKPKRSRRYVDHMHYDDFSRREERMAYKIPAFYTQEHEYITVVKETPSRRITSYEKVNVLPVLPDAPVFKPEMDACLGYHPYMETLRANLQKYGIDGILDPLGVDDADHQLLPQQANTTSLEDFELNIKVVKNANKDQPSDVVGKIKEHFEYGMSGAYSIYNWELFFHIPFLLANRFLIEGNHKEALRWMHYVFDPRETEGDSSSKYWKFKPFADYNATVSIEDLLLDLNLNGDEDSANAELNKQIELWSSDPFKPHNIAHMRPGAYMKAVVMRYLDIIIAHGDDLFRIDTTESINEAMQYYMIAAQLLGRKPEVVETEILEAKSYTDMQSGGMGNAIEYFEEGIIKPENAAYLEKFVESNELEIASKPFTRDKDLKGMVTDIYGAVDHEGDVAKLYFGIPKNDKLMAYWDRVADRLFKIRNSLNIDGIKRTVALFAPPIDPALLIRARQAGLDIGSVMRMAEANPTDYRFQTLLQRALEICSEVKSLGSQLLSALEKGDTEKISVLRAGHEKTLTELVTDIKEKSVEEAEEAIEQVKLQQESAQFRESYYRKKKKISGKEQQQLKFMDDGMALQAGSQALQLIAGSTNLFPDFVAGVSGLGSPVFTSNYGGTKLSNTGTMIASAMSLLGSISSHKGSKAGILAGYERRQQDWTFQADVAKHEIKQLKQQEVAAEIRNELAKLDRRNHEKQVEQTQESYDVLSTKFTNEQLYLWMAGELNTLYRSAFDMAYKMAKQAEAAYNFELCPEAPKVFVSANHFNAQNKGLLAGEKLYMNLKKMESDYLTDNKRRYELTKHVSLALLDPEKILELRNGGIDGATCEISIPEVLFDLDHPGQCNRRIKSVSLTIPCVTGAYTSVAANLTLNSSSIVTVENPDGMELKAKRNSIATSTAVSDSGLFELNFNDARYLPFEGAGVASSWTLTLPNKVRQFDYNSITDVIMHINYTAQDGLDRSTVEDNLLSISNELVKDAELGSMFSLKAQYPEAWAKVGTEDVTIEIKKSQLPFYLQGHKIDVQGVDGKLLSGQTQASLASPATTSIAEMGTTHTVTIPSVNVSSVDDLMIILKYKVTTT